MLPRKNSQFYWKRNFPRQQVSQTPYCRYLNTLRLFGRYTSLKHSLIVIVIFIAGIFLSRCSPPQLIQEKCPEPLWNKYSLLQSYQIKQETTRLEELLANLENSSLNSEKKTDSTDLSSTKELSVLEIKQRLFELSIHHFNREYDLEKAFQYATFLYQHGGPDSLRYLNWARPVRELRILVQERDSLTTAISTISDITKEEQINAKLVKKLTNEKKAYLKQYDSLSGVINAQQETIMKLQKLDIMMEKLRSNVR